VGTQPFIDGAGRLEDLRVTKNRGCSSIRRAARGRGIRGWIKHIDLFANMHIEVRCGDRATAGIRTVEPSRQGCQSMSQGRRLLLVVQTTLLLQFAAFAQPDELRFEQISVEDGLSQVTVHTIFQDDLGFMWFGTEDGLNRYDGRDFKIYRHDPRDAATLAHPLINSMVQDASGILWIGTGGGGLDRFDWTTESFSHYQQDTDDLETLSGEDVWSLCPDRHGNLWVGTWNGGLSRFDPVTGTFKRYFSDSSDPGSVAGKRVLAIEEDRSGRIWIGTIGHGLVRLVSGQGDETEHFLQYLVLAKGPTSRKTNIIRAIAEDSSGNLWVASNSEGALRFEESTGKFVASPWLPTRTSRTKSVGAIELFIDRTDVLWVGSQQNAIGRADLRRKKFTAYHHDPDDDNSLCGNGVYGVSEDPQGDGGFLPGEAAAGRTFEVHEGASRSQ